MTNLREAARMALDALLNAQEFVSDAFGMDEPYGDEIKALRAALAQPEPEPVAYDINGATVYIKPPVYTAPPQREWQGLTDEEIHRLKHHVDWTAGWTYGHFARAVESALKEKNT